MIQYTDGSFSEDLPLKEVLSIAEIGIDNVRSIHFGNAAELNKVRNQKGVEARVDELERQIRDLQPVTSSLIYIPTQEQIENLK